jgi:F-type H+-transporting ATPase subunit b
VSLELLAQVSQIAGAIIFLIAVILIWNRFIAPAVQGYQQSKNAELAEAEARRERIRADAAAARGEVERADADAREIVARSAAAAERERRKAIEEAKADAQRLVRNAEGELDRARLAARDRLRIELIEKALAKARAEAPARVSDATDQKLVELTIDDVTKGNV